MKILAIMLTLATLVSCGGFKAKRISGDQSDAAAMEITDKWVARDTELSVSQILDKMKEHRGFKRYLLKLGRRPKVFVADYANKTSEQYFPTNEITDEFLTQLSESGDYILIDAAARERLLKEIQYQNDGMVDPRQAKTIGKQSGADIMIFGNVNMTPRQRNGKTLKEYSLNLRMTDIEKAEEVMRTRVRINKFSEKGSVGW